MIKTQVIKRKCCRTIFAAAIEPYCYTDEDWTKSLKKYVKEGCEVDMVTKGGVRFERCKCQTKLDLIK